MRNVSGSPGTRIDMWVLMRSVQLRWSTTRYSAARSQRACHSASVMPMLVSFSALDMAFLLRWPRSCGRWFNSATGLPSDPEPTPQARNIRLDRHPKQPVRGEGRIFDLRRLGWTGRGLVGRGAGVLGELVGGAAGEIGHDGVGDRDAAGAREIGQHAAEFGIGDDLDDRGRLRGSGIIGERERG